MSESITAYVVVAGNIDSSKKKGLELKTLGTFNTKKQAQKCFDRNEEQYRFITIQEIEVEQSEKYERWVSDNQAGFYLLYILKHQTRNLFKIGITCNDFMHLIDNPEYDCWEFSHRFAKLNREYNINWNESLGFKGTKPETKRFEQALHKKFETFNSNALVGLEGGTEWFDLSCLKEVIAEIKEDTDFVVENEAVNIGSKFWIPQRRKWWAKEEDDDKYDEHTN